jgi:2-C-methyl-D-erythritol 4-phosphate cytidylyltransferase
MLKCGMAQFHVLIPAAGFGQRIGAEIPKQYLLLLGKPLIQHTLTIFMDCPRISSVSVVLSAEDVYWEATSAVTNSEMLQNSKIKVQRCGGAARSATVLNGLLSMQDSLEADDWVLVHDAVRPCLSLASLDNLLDTLENDTVGGLLAIPLADTLKRTDTEQRVAATLPREGLWLAQTPQMFRYGLLTKALQQSGDTPTDEAQAVEALGFKPKLVAGELRNLKVTYPQDLVLAEAILAANMEGQK